MSEDEQELDTLGEKIQPYSSLFRILMTPSILWCPLCTLNALTSYMIRRMMSMEVAFQFM